MDTNALIGQRFERLVVVGSASTSTNKHPRVACRCDCGQLKDIDARNLTQGKSKSCGCLRAELSSARRSAQNKEILGQVFSRLTPLHRVEDNKFGHHVYRCSCTCGKFVDAVKGNLVAGQIQSCGCLNDEARRLRVTHGMRRSSEYRVWRAMLNRCYNPNLRGYANYGGRGIEVCNEWKVFEQFFLDMGVRPSLDFSIERIDNSGDYQANNCRWATPTEQGRNKRNNLLLELGGVKRPASEWAEITGIKSCTIRRRKYVGWSDEAALTTPVKGK